MRMVWITVQVLIGLYFFSALQGKELEINEKEIPPKYRSSVIKQLNLDSEINSKWMSFVKKAIDSEREDLLFLFAYMPERDLRNLSPDFIKKNADFCRDVFNRVSWKDHVPDSVYLNYVLPYFNVNERRDDWREDFYKRFHSLVDTVETISQGVLVLNSAIWDQIDVHYSRKRPKADQSPYESMEAKMASCTGLSILLIDACRSVGIPARFTGILQWPDVRGNHSWVEIWDGRWYCVGAGEPGPLNKTWFMDRAKKADPTDFKHAIYAVSYEKTGVYFPVSWRRDIEPISAINVTKHYMDNDSPSGTKAGVMVFYGDKSNRVKARVAIYRGKEGKEKIGEGETKDENADFNDILEFSIEKNKTYLLRINYQGKIIERQFMQETQYEVINIVIKQEIEAFRENN